MVTRLSRIRKLLPVNMIENKNFWIILFITAFITYIYYDWYGRYIWFWHFSVFEFRNDFIGGLYYIPFIYAACIFGLRGSVFIWLLSFLLIIPRMSYYTFGPIEMTRNISLFIAPLLVLTIITLERKWKDRQRSMLAENERERQLYTAQILKAQEEERQRIAEELHDGVIQELIVIANLSQSAISKQEKGDGDTKQVEDIRDRALLLSKEVRLLSLHLRPSVLKDIGLISAIRLLAARLNQENGIDTRVTVEGIETKLIPDNEVTVFRIAQEALNNIKRHSKATQVNISVEYLAESLKLDINDNGKGFSINRVYKKQSAETRLGLISMQQRTKLLDGSFNVKSQLGHGTRVSIDIPTKKD